MGTQADDPRRKRAKMGKSKKAKKGRMQKVDTRILGFSTTSAPDRINVGDREYPDDL
uniref:Uncharacterized protein n=1 Tax=Rhodnius prolixus TaxID=13249 RepID=T1IEM4_RHOPR